MSVNTETASAQGQTTVLEKEGVYASLFEKINLTPASSMGDINAFLDDAALSDAPAGERLTAAMQVFMDCIRKSGQPVEKLDKTLIDHHIAELDFQISRQLDAVMHHQEFSYYKNRDYACFFSANSAQKADAARIPACGGSFPLAGDEPSGLPVSQYDEQR